MKTKLKITTSLIFLSLLVVCCNSNKEISKTYKTNNCVDESKTVDFRRLFDSTSSYNGQFVEISGYYQSGFEESAIYDRRTNRKSEFAIWTDFSPGLEKIVVSKSPKEFTKMNGRK